MFFLSKKWSGIGALKFGWKAFPLNLTDVNFRCSLKYVLSCETVYGIQPNRVSVYYKPVFKILKDWPLYPYTDKHMHTDTYIFIQYTHSTYVVAQPEWAVTFQPFFLFVLFLLLCTYLLKQTSFYPCGDSTRLKPANWSGTIYFTEASFLQTLCNSFSIHVLF